MFDKTPQTLLQRFGAALSDAGVYEEGRNMNPVKIIGVVLIVAGILGLAYGSFSFTKETHEAKIGPLEFQVKEKETVNVPVWAGVGAIVIGAVLLLVPMKR
jgi:multidrug transporter EmrE-like cation transporter